MFVYRANTTYCSRYCSERTFSVRKRQNTVRDLTSADNGGLSSDTSGCSYSLLLHYSRQTCICRFLFLHQCVPVAKCIRLLIGFTIMLKQLRVQPVPLIQLNCTVALT